MRKLLAALAVVAVAIAGTLVVASGADAASCTNGSWPADVQGRPVNLHKLGAEGLYIWRTSKGWELAVTHEDNTKVTFTGTVRTDGALYGTTRRTERSDHVYFAEDAGGVHYRFNNYGGLDGIAFRTRCSNRLTFDGSIDGTQLTAQQVFIGADGHHPGGLPFVITRT